MSKMLLPTELDTAMSPCPFLATARLESASGMLVPPASSVRPIIVSGMLAVWPRTVHIQTMTYERAPIIEMHMKKVMGYHLARSSRAQSGMIAYMKRLSGMHVAQRNLPNIVSGTSNGSNGPSSSSSSSSPPSASSAGGSSVFMVGGASPGPCSAVSGPSARVGGVPGSPASVGAATGIDSSGTTLDRAKFSRSRP